MTTKYEVYDRNGKRVHNHDGVLRDGQFIRTKLTMLDAVDPGLAAAAALADAVKRAETFDALRGHRPGFVTPQAHASSDAAREARDAHVRDSWRELPVKLDATQPVQRAWDGNMPDPTSPHSAHAERVARTRDAWKAA